ncbi:MAG: cyclic nucleotide-binding domain-containing protein [Rhodospirillales bacterium]
MRTILDFCHGLPERSYLAGETWIAEGAKTDTLTILIDGMVEVVKGDVQVHVATEPGSVFGEISALLDIPHTATVRTLSAARAYVVADAGHFLRQQPELTYYLSKLMAQRLHGMTTYLADMRAQFQDRDDHLGLVDEVLESLMHQQDEEFLPGSIRHPDPKI